MGNFLPASDRKQSMSILDSIVAAPALEEQSGSSELNGYRTNYSEVVTTSDSRPLVDRITAETIDAEDTLRNLHFAEFSGLTTSAYVLNFALDHGLRGR